MVESLLKIDIHKEWKKPQQIIFQKLEFNQLKEMNKDKNIEIKLQNKKTGITIRMTINKSLLKKI